MMLAKLLAITVLTKRLLADCAAGCLVCGPDDLCTVCDSAAAYYPANKTCAISTKTNCALVDSNGVCLKCANGPYYLDGMTGNCVAVPQSLQVANCAVHLGPTACAVCEQGFYPEGIFQCVQATNPVSNCQTQDTNVTCAACSRNYVPNDNRTNCTQIALANCSLVSQASCVSCKSGYIYNQNFAFSKLYDPWTAATQAAAIREAIAKGGFSTLPLLSCYNIQNCLEYNTTDFTCVRCADGFSFNQTAFTCSQNPLPRTVDFCAVYQTPTTCATCMKNYLLASPTSCVPLAPIRNCLAYNLSAPMTFCVECANFTYQTPTGHCFNRTVWNVNSCVAYAKFSDYCTACADAFVLTSDGKSCLLSIANCASYAESNANQASLTCSACAIGFYRNQANGVCTAGTVANCESFALTSDTCTVCKNAFYLTNGLCAVSNSIPNCQRYSQSNPAQCASCVSNAVKFSVAIGCVAPIPIANCIVYSSLSQCSACVDGMFVSSNTCLPVNSPNCIKYSGPTCIMCAPGYVFSGNNCTLASPTDSTNCVTNIMLGTNKTDTFVGCLKCASDSNPVNLTNAYVCQPAASLTAANAPNALATNCVGWKLNTATNQYSCIRCAQGYFLESSACVSVCSSGTPQKYTYSFSGFAANGIYATTNDIYKDYCGATLLANCNTATPAQSQTSTTATYGCADCKSGFLHFYTLTAPSILSPTASKFWQTVPGVNACSAPSTAILASDGTGVVPSCAYYLTYPSYGKSVCIACKFGFSGPVRNLIVNCVRYSLPLSASSVCTQCVEGFHIAPGGTSCQPNVLNANCTRYDSQAVSTSCLECILNNAYITFSNGIGTCNAREYVESSCLLYNMTADNCLFCDPDGPRPVFINYICYANITNCLFHVPYTPAPHYQCSVCDPTVSYYDSSATRVVCATGTVANCGLYSQTAVNVCLKCAPGYTLYLNLCYSAIPAPDTFGRCLSSSATACSACWYDSPLFTITSTCQPIVKLANCETMLTYNKCQTCAAGFYFETGSVCSAIPASTNCAVYVPVDMNGDGVFTDSDYHSDGTPGFMYTCHKCKADYYYRNTSVTVTYNSASTVVKIATCVAAASVPSVTNCTSMNSDGLSSINSIDCNGGCAANTQPVSFDGLRICVPATYFSPGVPSVANCAAYGPSGIGTYVCKYCLFGYGLEDGACVASCSGGNQIVYFDYDFDSTIPFSYKIARRNECLNMNTWSVPNCRIYTPAVIQTSGSVITYVCARCASGYVPIITLNRSYSTLLKPYTTVNAYTVVSPVASGEYTVRSPFEFFVEPKECLLQSSTTFAGQSVGALQSNCEMYGLIKPGTYGCVKCVAGYTSTIQAVNDLSMSYLNSCQTDASVSTATAYTGWNTERGILESYGPLNVIFSAQACQTAGQVPFAFLAFHTTGDKKVHGFGHWAPKSGTTNKSLMAVAQSLTGMQKNIVCVDPSSSANDAKYWTTAQRTACAVANCALYVINTAADVVDTATVNSAATRSHVCVACLPGYKPQTATYTEDSFSWTYISSCTAITNCGGAPGTQLNVCSTCSYPKALDQRLVSIYECSAATPIANCFLADSPTTCLLCSPGFKIQNGRTSCAAATVAQGDCTDFQTQQALEAAMSAVNWKNLVFGGDYGLIPYFELSDAAGCKSCATGTLVVANSTLDNVLTTQSCVPVELNLVNTAAYPYNVTNCAKFGFQQTPTSRTTVGCIQCNSGFVVANSSFGLFTCEAAPNPAKPNLANCAIYSLDSDVCLVCSSSVNALIFDGLCTVWDQSTLTAMNCLTLDLAASQTAKAWKCKVCAWGYQLSSGACSLVTGNAVANCAAVNDAGVCIHCHYGYVLASVGGVKTCVLVFKGVIDSFSRTDHDVQCRLLDEGLFETFKLACTSCNPGYLPTPTANGAITNFCYRYPGYAAVANCAQFTAVGSTYSTISLNCLKCQDYSNYYLSNNVCNARTAASKGVQKCVYFTETADTCANCTTNYTIGSNVCNPLPSHSTNTPWVDLNPSTWLRQYLPNALGYLETCTTAVSGCNGGSQFDGLTAPWNLLFSCHRCSVGGQIPFVFAHAGNGTYSGVSGLFSYALNSTGLAFGWYDGGSAVRCLSPAAGSFHPSYSGKFAFPANCALGLVNVWANFDASMSSSAAGVDLTKIGVMCVACAPGFKAAGATDLSSSTVPGMVSSCTSIANCQSSNTVNLCDQCVSNFIFAIDASGNVDFSACVSQPIPFCQFANSANKCVACVPGYYLNLDGVCETLQSPNCATANGQFELGFNALKAIQVLFFQPNKGCTGGCASGFLPAAAPVSISYCHKSTQMGSRPANSKFTPNCLNYRNRVETGLNVLCSVCKTGFTITTAGTCILTPDANCLVALSATVCVECPANYSIIRGVCHPQNIPNCVLYSTTILSSLVCISCANSYYLHGNACLAGSIPNCAVYSSPVTCVRCNTDFALRVDFDRVTSCVPSPVPMDCDVLLTSAYNNGQFTCQTCKKNYFYMTAAIGRDFCYPFAAVVNCTSYDVKQSVSASSYACTGCADGAYLNKTAGDCRPRTAASLANCTVVDPNDDVCIKRPSPPPIVVPPPVVAPMTPQPIGIVGCLTYRHDFSCLVCDSLSYSNGTACLPVAQSRMVQNCVRYDPSQNCLKCQAGQAVRNGLCVPIIGKNCATLEMPSTHCATCLPGFGLFSIANVATCVKLNTTNCLQWASIYPYGCVLCAPGHTVVNSSCHQINATIANCQSYSADGVCSACASGFGLLTNSTANSTACVAADSLAVKGLLDPNCGSFSYSQTGFCALCSPGFALQGTQCQPCADQAGCALCDPGNLAFCLMCNSGYYMKSPGKCFKQ